VAGLHLPAPQHMQEATAWTGLEPVRAAQRSRVEKRGTYPEMLQQCREAVRGFVRAT
jgi:hypothetical protein